ncbi:unnamed protein product [Adineta steineri]|uniref:14-3-3 domain-containing protein n=1 Tax=Adineta steineri TaxID=433720 RepID=A0A819UD75_9BILA|nr:unnamed protein product [Adineta steineri]
MTNKDEQVQLAKLAEQAERYTDMVIAMKNVVKFNGELTTEERDLLLIAYKHTVSACRLSWRIISIIEQKGSGSERQREMAKEYREKIENELKDICQQLFILLDKYLIPKATTAESKIVYLKTKGDYYRYLTEVTTGSERQKFAGESGHAYKNAFDMAKNQMSVTHPIRLGLALSFSVFFYEILNNTDAACRIAIQALDEALTGSDSLENDSYRDSIVIMQSLRDNLNAWTDNSSDVNDTNQSKEQ